MPPTKKRLNGRRVDEILHGITISKIEDEWFLVRGVVSTTNEMVKCDQLDGLLEYFKNRFGIK